MNHFFNFILATLLFCSFSQAQQKSILFIGNSYTAGNNLPTLIRDLAAANGKNLYVEAHTPGGAPFDSHANNPAVYNLIKSRNWDYVVLQGQSQEVSFPDNQVDFMTLPPAVRLADSVYANNYCSQVLMYMTWGRKNGDIHWGENSTYQGMQNRLYNGYMRIADSAQASVAPVGKIWELIRGSVPNVELYESDESHPTYAGSYLAAMTFYSSIFHELPTNLAGVSNLPAHFTNQIKVHIQEEILNQMNLYNLRAGNNQTFLNEFSISQYSDIVHGSARTRKAQHVYWYFGDGAETQGWNVQYQYPALGTYTITTVARSECNYSTLTRDITIDVLAVPTIDHGAITFEFNQLNVGEGNQASLYNTSGQLILTFQNQADLTIFSNGVYLVNVKGSLYRFYKH